MQVPGENAGTCRECRHQERMQGPGENARTRRECRYPERMQVPGENAGTRRECRYQYGCAGLYTRTRLLVHQHMRAQTHKHTQKGRSFFLSTLLCTDHLLGKNPGPRTPTSCAFSPLTIRLPAVTSTLMSSGFMPGASAQAHRFNPHTKHVYLQCGLAHGLLTCITHQLQVVGCLQCKLKEGSKGAQTHWPLHVYPLTRNN